MILTKHAEKFVSKLTFEALCHNYVETDLFDESNEDPIAHITLAKWADLMIIVPATANIIAKVTHGISDDLLSTTFLACNKHKMICPAMNTQMYENPITQKNIQACKDLGYQILDPVVGHLACNDTGKGKMIEPADIVEAIDNYFNTSNKLSGKTVLISAGPTQEAMDPVRFISNHSSGKQGYAIAKAAKAMGANVILVSFEEERNRYDTYSQDAHILSCFGNYRSGSSPGSTTHSSRNEDHFTSVIQHVFNVFHAFLSRSFSACGTISSS